MPSVFNWQVRVYYEDTDAGGIVFYANYLKFFERARTEWLRAQGVQQQALLDYHAAARLDDELTIRTHVEKLGRASVQFIQEAWRGDVLLNTASVKVGCVDTTTMRPRPLPDDVAAKMRAA